MSEDIIFMRGQEQLVGCVACVSRLLNEDRRKQSRRIAVPARLALLTIDSLFALVFP